MKIILSGIVEGINTRADGSVKVVFGTQELQSKAAGDLFQLRGKMIKCLLSDTNISEEQVKEVEQTELERAEKVKTQSQRLRNVLYRQWEQNGKQVKWEEYYRNSMEAMITSVKQTLE